MLARAFTCPAALAMTMASPFSISRLLASIGLILTNCSLPKSSPGENPRTLPRSQREPRGEHQGQIPHATSFQAGRIAGSKNGKEILPEEVENADQSQDSRGFAEKEYSAPGLCLLRTSKTRLSCDGSVQGQRIPGDFCIGSRPAKVIALVRGFCRSKES